MDRNADVVEVETMLGSRLRFAVWFSLGFASIAIVVLARSIGPAERAAIVFFTTATCLIFIFMWRRQSPLAWATLIFAVTVFHTVMINLNSVDSELGMVWYLAVPALITGTTRRLRDQVLVIPALIGLLYTYNRLVQSDPTWRSSNVIINVLGTMAVITASCYSVLYYFELDKKRLKNSELAAQTLATERLELADRAADAEAVKSQFIAAMSHELRSPLMGIIGSTDMLLESGLSESQWKMVSMLQNSSISLAAILDGALDLSSVERGEFDPRVSPFLVADLASDVAHLFQSAVRHQQIRFVVDPDPSMPAIWLGDADRIRQILTNLVGNAVNHSNASMVRIRLSGNAQSGEGDAGEAVRGLRIRVEDNGIGVTENQMADLFLPFTRIERPSGSNHNGSGLGLWISSNLAEAMGGTLKAASPTNSTVSGEQNSGLSVSLQLPGLDHRADRLVDRYVIGPTFKRRRSSVQRRVELVDSNPWLLERAARWSIALDLDAEVRLDPTTPSVPPSPGAWNHMEADANIEQLVENLLGVDQASATNGHYRFRSGRAKFGNKTGRITVGVIDDDAMLAAVLVEMLTVSGLSTKRIPAPYDSASLHKALPVDLLLIDYFLPQTSGLTILNDLRSNGYTKPICVLSGSPSAKQPALANGADRFLLKPVRLNQLLEVVDDLVET